MKVALPERAVEPSSATRTRTTSTPRSSSASCGASARSATSAGAACRSVPRFRSSFELVDATDAEVAGLSFDGFEEVNELCYHCKLCYNHCPYTPPHEWDVDFPALMRRQQVARAAREGVPARAQAHHAHGPASASSPRSRRR